MKLSWPHAVVYVRDQEKMIGFLLKFLRSQGQIAGHWVATRRLFL
jgi:DNA-binding helix-hairpin-helix protein with protein kinase domain